MLRIRLPGVFLTYGKVLNIDRLDSRGEFQKPADDLGMLKKGTNPYDGIPWDERYIYIST